MSSVEPCEIFSCNKFTSNTTTFVPASQRVRKISVERLVSVLSSAGHQTFSHIDTTTAKSGPHIIGIAHHHTQHRSYTFRNGEHPLNNRYHLCNLCLPY